MRTLYPFIQAFVLAIVLASGLLPTQTLAQQAQLCTRTRLLLHWLDKYPSVNQIPASELTYLGIRDGRVPVLLQAKGGLAQLGYWQEQGAADVQAFGPVISMLLPLEKLKTTLLRPEVQRVEMHLPMGPMLWQSREQTHADMVHVGFDLPRAFHGDSVVLGIIDLGFDYAHPAFANQAGKLRISRVWDQSALPGVGTPPAGFTYGAEYTTPAAILASGTDTTETHGTHVSCIAGGSKTQTERNNDLRGMADSADLVMVDIDFGKTTDIWTQQSLNGIAYIRDYAASQGRRHVVNMSYGHKYGPRDGTSLQDAAYQALADAGSVLVASAGNSGYTNMHIEKKFAAGDTVRTIAYKNYNFDRKIVELEVWGKNASNVLSAQIALYDSSTRSLLHTSFWYSSARNAARDTVLVVGNDSLKVRIVADSANAGNGRSNLFIAADNPGGYVYGFHYTATVGAETHAFNCTRFYGAHLSKRFPGQGSGNLPGYYDGNTSYTIGFPGGSNGVICVGAFASKDHMVNLAGQSLNLTNYLADSANIAYFSSKGPLLDGRNKPDITGPGMFVNSAISSFYYPEDGDTTFFYDVTLSGGKRYLYESLSGTSMSSPAVAGCIALLLQANKNLSAAQVKDLIMQTAYTDDFAVIFDDASRNTWGAGKIDIHAAIRRTLGLDQNSRQLLDPVVGFHIGPNPCQGSLGIHFQALVPGALHLQLCDLQGRLCYSQTAQVWDTGLQQLQLDLNHLPAGLYALRWSDGHSTGTQKVMLR